MSKGIGLLSARRAQDIGAGHRNRFKNQHFGARVNVELRSCRPHYSAPLGVVWKSLRSKGGNHLSKASSRAPARCQAQLQGERCLPTGRVNFRCAHVLDATRCFADNNPADGAPARVWSFEVVGVLGASKKVTAAKLRACQARFPDPMLKSPQILMSRTFALPQSCLKSPFSGTLACAKFNALTDFRPGTASLMAKSK